MSPSKQQQKLSAHTKLIVAITLNKRDRDRVGHVLSEHPVPVHVAPLLQHHESRQRIRARERHRCYCESLVSRAHSSCHRKEDRLHYVDFVFMFGSSISAGESTFPLLDQDVVKNAPHENIAVSCTVEFPKSDSFHLGMLSDATEAWHRDNMKSSSRTQNPKKAEALCFVSRLCRESVANWIETADSDTVRFHVDEVLTNRCYRTLDVRDTADNVIGQVRIAPNTMRLPV